MKLNSNLEVLKKTDKISYSDQLFGIKTRIKVHHFSEKTELNTIDSTFDKKGNRSIYLFS